MTDYKRAWQQYKRLRTQFLALAWFHSYDDDFGRAASSRMFHDERLLFAIMIAAWMPFSLSRSSAFVGGATLDAETDLEANSTSWSWFDIRKRAHCGLSRM